MVSGDGQLLPSDTQISEKKLQIFMDSCPCSHSTSYLSGAEIQKVQFLHLLQAVGNCSGMSEIITSMPLRCLSQK